MTKRQVKKQAKRFLEGRGTNGVHFVFKYRYPRSDGSVVISERVPTSRKFDEAVTNYIGVVSHWDSPYIVYIDEDGVYEPEYGFSAQYCARALERFE